MTVDRSRMIRRNGSFRRLDMLRREVGYHGNLVIPKGTTVVWQSF